MAFKILVAHPVHETVLDLLGRHGEVEVNPGPEPFSPHELASRCRDASALMAFMTERVDAALLESCSQLRIVAGALKGHNNFDVAACSRRGIAVTVVPDLLTEPTAELAIGLMISVARHLVPGDAYVRSGAFKGWRARFYGGSLVGATVAVIGAGAVGRAIMRMAGGFDCECIYVDKKPLPPEEEARLRCRRSELEPALARADFVVLCIHLMPETWHIVDRDFVAAMKPASYLINPARGSLVDENAVAEALQSGQLAGYAADTFELEDWALDDRPRTVSDGLAGCGQTVLTPHIGSAVRRVREAIELSAAQSIIDVAQGRVPAAAVNKDAL